MTSQTWEGPLIAGAHGAPSLVVLGAPRSGTTTVSRWLSDAGLGVGVKDSFYLMDPEAGLRGPTHLSVEGVSGYLDLFSGLSGTAVEVAAGYLYQQTALEFFRSWETPPQFVVIVRDPVARLRSVYRYFSGNLGLLPRDMDFDAFVDALFADTVGLPDQTVSGALKQGAYADAIEPWVEVFGKERIHVFNFDAIENDPARFINELCELAGTTPSIDLSSYGYEAFNSSYVPRSKALAKATAWGRRWMPSGKFRSWGGEKIRRLQSRRAPDAPAPVVPTALSDAVARVSDFYRDPNARLARDFGIDTRRWT